jgi:hypothetical protein
MIFRFYENEGRRTLQADETSPDFAEWKENGGKAHYDSFIMSQRGQDFDAVYNEIANNPEHTIIHQEVENDTSDDNL